MRVSTQKKSIFPFVAAILLIGAIAVTLGFLSLSLLKNQKDIVDASVFMQLRTIARGVESGILRSQGENSPEKFRARVKEIFNETSASGEIAELALLDAYGNFLESTTYPPPMISEDAWVALFSKNEWLGFTYTESGPVLAYMTKASPYFQTLYLGNDDEEILRRESLFILVLTDPAGKFGYFEKYEKDAVKDVKHVFWASLAVGTIILLLLWRREQGGKLFRLETFQSALLDALPDGLLTLDGQGKIISANPGAARILSKLLGKECSVDEIIGTSFDKLSLEEDNSTLQASLFEETLLSSRERDDAWQRLETKELSLEILSLPLQNKNPKDKHQAEDRSLVIIRDRTGLRSLEKDLEEAQRLAALGGMAAGMAHEIRNPLSSLRGFAQYFRQKMSGKEPEATYARTMIEEADRLNSVVTNMLHLARPKPIAKTRISLTQVVQSIEELVGMEMKHRLVVFKTRIENTEVWADKEALRTILLNLVINSLAAFQENKLDSKDDQPPRIEVSSALVGDWSKIAVSDNGPGMSAETISQALEPFFTTKANGSGLGLAIVDVLTRQHGGYLEIESEPGQGTKVGIFLPYLSSYSEKNKLEDHL